MGRPSTPLIDKSVAVKTALRLIDSEGLEAITLRRLAAELGVATASLYHHFEDKAALLRSVCELIYRETPVPDQRTERWADFISRCAYEARETILQHPNALPLLVRADPRTIIPANYEQFGRLLVARGLPADMVTVVMYAIDTLVTGSAALKVGRDSGDESSVEGPAPGLAAWEEANPRDADEMFQLVCHALGEGLEAYISSSNRS